MGLEAQLHERFNLVILVFSSYSPLLNRSNVTFILLFEKKLVLRTYSGVTFIFFIQKILVLRLLQVLHLLQFWFFWCYYHPNYLKCGVSIYSCIKKDKKNTT